MALYRRINLTVTLGLLCLTAPAWAVPDRLMNIVPVAISNTTIFAADENSRNNEASTKYNAHDHLSTGSSLNTFTIGDGDSGNKVYQINNSFTTSPGLRYNDVIEQWEGANDGTTWITFVGESSTNTFTIGDGDNGPKGIAVDNSFTTSPAFRYDEGCECWQTSNDGVTFNDISTVGGDGGAIVSNIVTLTRSAAAGTGVQAITGLGFRPKALWATCDEENSTFASWGHGDDDTDQSYLQFDDGTGLFSSGTDNIAFVGDATNLMTAVYTSDDADGFSWTWTKSNAGQDVACKVMGIR